MSFVPSGSSYSKCACSPLLAVSRTAFGFVFQSIAVDAHGGDGGGGEGDGGGGEGGGGAGGGAGGGGDGDGGGGDGFGGGGDGGGGDGDGGGGDGFGGGGDGDGGGGGGGGVVIETVSDAWQMQPLASHGQ